MSTPRATVLGAGLSGLACARALREAGVDVRVRDRGRRPGGRLGGRTLRGGALPDHLVDTGAAYFTVDGDPRHLGTGAPRAGDDGFAAVVDRLARAGVVAPWTDTFHLAGPRGVTGTKTGPLRWRAPGGLRGLADALAEGLDVAHDAAATSVGVRDGLPAVDGEVSDAVVLAMPDPQASALLEAADAPALAAARDLLDTPWDPSIVVWGRWQERWWPALDAAFVTDDGIGGPGAGARGPGEPMVSLVLDDGRRRGDDQAVLVVHTLPSYAAGHLQRPGEVVTHVLARAAALLGVDDVPAPLDAGAMRWSLSAPQRGHEEPFHLAALADGHLGVCGDGWGGPSKVSRAWTSGHELGVELAERLTAG